MELFRTIVKCTGSPEKINYETPFLMLGSCFAESIGHKFQYYKFNIALNPFGIIYHPHVLSQNIRRMVVAKPYTGSDLHLHDGLWCSFDHHGRFSHPDKDKCLKGINHELRQAHRQLANAKLIFITFGTAWAYRRKSDGVIVANCHKFPASDFERIRISENEIYENWMGTLAELKRFNPGIKIIFTVSPVRHLRDGAHENQLSKSVLLLATNRLNSEVKNTGYFPAYEIMLDELRDYRFYDEDMIHPGALAVNYIWERFRECYVGSDAWPVMEEIGEIVKASGHRPIHYSPANRKFADTYLEKAERMEQKYPFPDFSKEKELFERMLRQEYL